VVAYHRSGRVLSVTFVRGREAFALDDREAQKLTEALVEKPKGSDG
jgi:hypothetical protein